MSIARRALRSMTVYRPEKAYHGFTLFTPMIGSPSNTWLIDMEGRFVHRWKLGGWCKTQAVLLPTGNLLYCIRRLEQAEAEDLPFLAHELIETDWEGNVVWSYAEPYMDSHDWIRLKNGNTLINKFTPVPKDIANKVKGGFPGSELNGVMWGYRMQEITPGGKIAWEWVSYEHLDPELDAIVSPADARRTWPLFNSLTELTDGNIMACSPYTSNIYIIDRTNGAIKWRWGKNIIFFPHNPSMLDNGNILVLDNGRCRINPPNFLPPDWSRVIEVNPTTGRIEWEYRAENPVDFYTTYVGGCERLPNGNTLICEGARGRFFEVTPKGEIVWEYIVPFYAFEPVARSFGVSNATFRAHRYGPDYSGLQGKDLDPTSYETWNRLYALEPPANILE